MTGVDLFGLVKPLPILAEVQSSAKSMGSTWSAATDAERALRELRRHDRDVHKKLKQDGKHIQLMELGDAQTLTLVIRFLGVAPEGLESLSLSANDFDDSTVVAFADIFRTRPFASLSNISLCWAQVSDAGLAAIADVLCDRSVLVACAVLSLHHNNIGDAGVHALAAALQKGGLAKLSNLDLRSNAIGDAGVASLVAAAQNCDAHAMQQLSFLQLEENRIGNAGMEHLAGAIIAAAQVAGAPLWRLSIIGLEGNPGRDYPVRSALEKRGAALNQRLVEAVSAA